MSSHEKVSKAVLDGLKPFKTRIKKQITPENIDTLLKIPIRRISLYDINRAKKEVQEIRERLREIKANLSNLNAYAVTFLQDLIKKYQKAYPRKTERVTIEQVDARDAAQRNLKLCYDKKTGYLGHQVNGVVLFAVSPYDRVLAIRKTGAYSVHGVPEKLFVDRGMLFCGFVDEARVYTIVYRENKTGYPYIKRCRIDKFILNRGYNLIPEGCRALKLTTDFARKIALEYKPKPRLRVLQEEFSIKDYPVRGNKARGIRLSTREVKSARFV